MEYLKGLVLILICSNIILSLFLIFEIDNEESFCLSGKGCDIVKNSPYSNLNGIPVSVLGFTSFLFLLLAFILDYKEIIPGIIFLKICFIASVFALYFLYLQVYVIKAICSSCLYIDLTTLLITLVTGYNFLEKE